MAEPLPLIAILCGIVALLFLLTGIGALRRRRIMGFTTRTSLALLFLALAGAFATITLGIQGYQSLTREEVAATIEVRPTGPQTFTAYVKFPDGRREVFKLAGDQIYVDAHILKWNPLANVIGLHTAYELDRVGGRYVDLQAERDRPRTVYTLSEQKPVNMFDLRHRYAFLAPLLDAEYGSGTFLMADRPATLEVRVSTTGLLLRPAPETRGG
jgi:hypothetical protein